MATSTIATVLKPDISRYRRLSKRIKRMSLTRALQYEALGRQPPRGKVLDVGGGEFVGYRELLICEEYKSINIDPKAGATWTINIDQRFPCPDESFDSILSMNTLEHVFNTDFLLAEMYRVLKPSGTLVAAVPFLYPIHAHPDDFFRPTPSWFFKSLGLVGFQSVVVNPLVWGPFSTGVVCSGAPGPFKLLRRRLAMLMDIFYLGIRKGDLDDAAAPSFLHKQATAFFVTAEK